MSATSNKSRILLFMMVVIALVFFITSFLAVAFSNNANAPNVATVGQQETAASNCIFVQTAEHRLFADCIFG